MLVIYTLFFKNIIVALGLCFLFIFLLLSLSVSALAYKYKRNTPINNIYFENKEPSAQLPLWLVAYELYGTFDYCGQFFGAIDYIFCFYVKLYCNKITHFVMHYPYLILETNVNNHRKVKSVC